MKAPPPKKSLALVASIAAITVFLVLGPGRTMTLESLKANRMALLQSVHAAPVQYAAILFFTYVVAAALSLPVAAILTIAAGALFGLLWGTVVVSFASSIGATLAFLISRHVFSDSVRRRLGPRLLPVDDGIRRDGAFYLFAIRLVPVFPFFIVNLVMGLTPIPVRTFYWVTQVGMLPVALVYVNAGVRLAEIDSLSAIVTPRIAISLALFGLFPLVARVLLNLIRRSTGHTG